MKWLLKILAGLGALLAVLLFGSLLLPAYHRVVRATTIDASAAEVFQPLADFQQWRLWDGHHGLPHVVTSDPSRGVGAWREWRDKSDGRVRTLFTYQEANRSLYYRNLFYDHDVVAIGSLHLQPDGDRTNVVWTVAERVGMNPLKRWFSLFSSLRAGPELSEALTKLKETCEMHRASK